MRLNFRGFQSKVLGVLLVILIPCLASLVVLQSKNEYDEVLKAVSASSRHQTALIASQGRAGIERRDEALIESVYFDIAYHQNFEQFQSEIMAFRAFSKEGQTLKSFETLDAPDTVSGSLQEVAQLALKSGSIEERAYGSLTVVAAPVHPEMEDGVIGAVAIAWNPKNVVDEVWSNALRHAGFGMIEVVFTILALAFVIGRIIVHPITRLASHVSEVGATGSLASVADKRLLTRSGEVSLLAKSFNHMIADLALSRQKLIEASESEIKKHSDRLDAALTGMPHGLCMFDTDKRLVLCNERYAQMYQLPPHLAQAGTRLDDIVNYRASIGIAPVDRLTYTTQHDDLAAKNDTTVFNCLLEDGSTIRVSHRSMADGGYVASHEDVTAAIRAETQIAHMAHHDALTGLPNRVRLREELEHALARVRRGDKLSVLCLDLDRFKAVNDTLGHPVGDELLKQVAERLKACLRETDTVTRLGGDEFAIVQVGTEEPQHSVTVARRIIEALTTPFELHDHQVVIGTSVGIALAPEDSTCPDRLLALADMALYRAKAEGRGTYRFYEAGMDAMMQARRMLELDLRKAVATEEFEVYYQPLVRTVDGRVSGFEALLRWQHPERGWVSPVDFIPLAEEIGLINQIGAWVLRRACADAATWPDDVRVAVNLSSTQFKGSTLVGDVTSALEQSGLAPHRLELEITETVVLHDTEATLTTLHELRELGVRISMDDFGTGYSSLSYLRKFPFDKIKIDRSFIKDLPEKSGSGAIVRAITSMSGSLGMSTTAEGVETQEQLSAVMSEGCTEVQGYFYSKAVPLCDVAGLISSIGGETREAA